MIWLRRLAGLVLGLFVTLLLTATLMVSSESGSRWLISQALEFSGQDIELRGVEGRLIDELRIEKLLYRSAASKQRGRTEVQIQALRLVWDAAALWQQQIRVSTLSAAALDISLAAPADPSFELSVPALGGGWTIGVDQLNIDAMSLRKQQALTQLDEISLSALYQGERLSISDASLRLQMLEARLDGNVVLASPFNFDAKLNLKQPAWQAQTRLQVQGTPNEYTLEGTLSIAKPSLPELAGHYSGNGSLGELRLQVFQADTLAGTLQGSGLLNWKNALRLEFDVQGRDLQTTDWNADFPGKVNFSGQFGMLGQAMSLNLSADGRLRDYPLEVQLRAKSNTGIWIVEEGRLQSGPNQLLFTGGIASKGLEDLKVQLRAPQLATLHPDLAGKLSADGALSGPWTQLKGQAQLKAEALSYQSLALGALSIDLKPEKSSDVDAYQLQLKANELRYKDLRLSEVELKARGTAQQQGIDLRIQEQSGSRFVSRLDGKFEDRQWRAEISNSELDIGPWTGLKQAGKTQLQISRQNQLLRIMLSNYCLKGQQESICGEMQMSGQNLDAKLELQEIPMQALSKMSDTQTLPTMLLSGEIDLQGSASRWALSAAMQLDPRNTLSLEAGMDRQSGKLDGRARLSLAELKNLSLLSEKLSQTRGQLNADLLLSGTNIKPDVSGQIKLLDASSKLPGTGVSLEGVEVTATLLDFQRADIQGRLKSGSGNLTVSGQGQWWPAENQALDLRIRGENFLLIDLPEVYAEVSPDLTVSATPEQIVLGGEIAVPKLSVMLEDLSSQAIVVSEDTRIVGVAQPQPATPPRLPVTARIRLLLGENVSMNGMGLAVKLAGELQIEESPGKPLRANGQIDVREGSYTAYGQNLSLLESRLIFNGPVTEPGLDLKAQREIKARGAGRDVTVGLLVGGTLQSPVSELFSNPSMSDSDAVAYLLTGGPLSSAEDGEGSLMISALTQLGVKGSSGLIEKIQNSTGLSTFEIDAGNDVSETALKLGKYLTPQLYVQYVKRVFTDTQSILARYDINDRVYIETESGDNRSIDLKFQIER